MPNLYLLSAIDCDEVEDVWHLGDVVKVAGDDGGEVDVLDAGAIHGAQAARALHEAIGAPVDQTKHL